MNNPWRILHIFDHSIPLHSGYTFRSRALLREQRKLGWETYHLTSPKHTAPSAAEEVVDDLHFYRTPWQPRGWERAPVLNQWALMRATERRLRIVAEQVRPQLIHAHSPVLNAWPAIHVARELCIPVVYEVRAFWEDAAVDHGSTHEGSLRYRLTRALETRALQRVDHIFTICAGLRDEIAERGIERSKITLIPNAVDADAFTFDMPPDSALRTQLGLDNKTVIGFIGSFYAYEGLDLLIDAMPALLRTQPDIRLLLVGGGVQEAALREQVARLNLQAYVIFTGRVPHTEVQRYYSIVDVFAYPRKSMRLTDLVTPLKPLEAMAQGQLLVASDVGGHRELIRDGETGLLFRAGDAQALAQAILRMLAQRDRWPQLRRQGRDYIEQERHWARSASAYVPVYAQLLAQSS